MIGFEDVSVRYPEGPQALSQLSFTVLEGEFLAVLGPSGCGKTTLLKLINGLLSPTSGTVRVEGRELPSDPGELIRLRRRIGYVFQGFGLFPHLTVRENVALVPSLSGWAPDKVRERVLALLELVDLQPLQFGDRFPAALSGGQQQRVALARALAARPKVMLLDEPFSALDPTTRDELQGQYQKLHRSLGLTTVMVTHDIYEALLMADRILVMEAGQQVQLDSPKGLSLQPKTEELRRLLQMPRRQVRRLEQLFGSSHNGQEQ